MYVCACMCTSVCMSYMYVYVLYMYVYSVDGVQLYYRRGVTGDGCILGCGGTHV